MKITLSNMTVTKVLHDAGGNLTEVRASVYVTTTEGHLWWKKQTYARRNIQHHFGDMYWYFCDTKEATPEGQAEALFKAIKNTWKMPIVTMS